MHDELWSLRDEICIVGVGNTRYGNFPETDAWGLAVEAFRNALQDCGLEKRQIDGLVVNRVPSYARMGEILGLNPSWSLQLQAQGRMCGASIVEAALALKAGLCKYVALLYGNNGRSQRVRYGGDEYDTFWNPWGFTSPGAVHAMMFRRHMHLYGTTSAQLAEICIAFRKHAHLNPFAVMRDRPLTLEDYEAARPICEPLRLFDYCLINDGGVALIMTTRERARDLKKPPVFITGIGMADKFTDSSFPDFDFWYEPLQQCAARVYAMSGLRPSDIDALMVYDNFSPTVLFALEGMGFCPRGEGGRFVSGGALQLGGRLPTNTSGGHLSESYMQGWALNVEAVRQLRGECGDRQVPNCEVVQYVAATPRCVSIIYRR